MPCTNAATFGFMSPSPHARGTMLSSRSPRLRPFYARVLWMNWRDSISDAPSLDDGFCFAERKTSLHLPFSYTMKFRSPSCFRIRLAVKGHQINITGLLTHCPFLVLIGFHSHRSGPILWNDWFALRTAWGFSRLEWGGPSEVASLLEDPCQEGQNSDL